MRIVTLIVGILCIFAVLLDAFQTIILPRRASGRFRLTRLSSLPPGSRGYSSPTAFTIPASANRPSAITVPCR